MTVADLIERLQEQPQHLEVVIPDRGHERALHQPCTTASVRAACPRGGLGGWDLDEVEARTLVWQPGDEPVVVVVLGTEDGG